MNTPLVGLESKDGRHVDYMAKDYDSFLALMLDRLGHTLPQWKERLAADLGITLVELLAYAADQLSYYQDAVALEAYIDTAYSRISVQRHARLLGYRMQDGVNARTLVRFLARTAGAVVPAGTKLLPKGTAQSVVVTEQTTNIDPSDVPIFETMTPLFIAAEHNEMVMEDWEKTGGSIQKCLPDLAPNDFVLLSRAEGDTRQPGSALWPVRLTAVDTVDDAERTQVQWDISDDPTATFGSGSSLVALGNVVLADHGMTVSEPLPPVTDGRYRPKLQQRPITMRAPLDRLGPGRFSRIQEPQSVVAALSVSGPRGTWHARPDLLASSRFDRHVKVELDEDEIATLLFGDNEYGQAPRPGTELTAHYRVGVGPAGNLSAGTLGHVLSNEVGASDIAEVTNPVSAIGGTPPETAAETRLLAPSAHLTEVRRCVTAGDFVAVIERHDAVSRAVATTQWTGSQTTIFVYVEADQFDAGLSKELIHYLEPYRVLGHDVQLRPIVRSPVQFTVHAMVAPRADTRTVQARLERSLGATGFFAAGHLRIGEALGRRRLESVALQDAEVIQADIASLVRVGMTPPRPAPEELSALPWELFCLDATKGEQAQPRIVIRTTS